MSTTVPTTPTTEQRPTYANFSASVTLKADWADHIGRIVVTGSHGHFPVLSLHLDPEAAAQLAADLIAAVSDSGAGEVPDVLLAAFGNARDASLVSAGEVVGAALARGEQP